MYPKKEGRRQLTSIEDRVDTSIQQLEDCIKMGRGRLITYTRNNIGNIITNKIKIPENKNGKKRL